MNNKTLIKFKKLFETKKEDPIIQIKEITQEEYDLMWKNNDKYKQNNY